MTFATDMEYNITYLFTSYQLTFKMHKTRYSFYVQRCRVLWRVCIYILMKILFYLFTLSYFSCKIVVNFSCVCFMLVNPESLLFFIPHWISKYKFIILLDMLRYCFACYKMCKKYKMKTNNLIWLKKDNMISTGIYKKRYL